MSRKQYNGRSGHKRNKGFSCQLRRAIRQMRCFKGIRRVTRCNDNIRWYVFGGLICLLIISQIGIPIALLLLVITLVLIIYG